MLFRMTKNFRSLAARIILSCMVFCIVLAGVFTGWIYVQNHRDEALLRDFATQKLDINNMAEAKFIATHCSGTSVSAGNCSALRILSTEKQCEQIVSKLRGDTGDCAAVFADYKGHVFSVRPMGYSGVPGYFMEITLMEQHYFMNAL